MSTLVRVTQLAGPFRWWLLLAVVMSFGTLAAGIALMATSAYLISKAALVTGFSSVALAVVGVRSFAIARAALRYGERYVSHLAAFRILVDLRVRIYRAIEPLSPARLGGLRSGDLLTRIAADVETLNGFYVRAVVPPAASALAIALAAVIVGSFNAVLGLVLLAFLLAGVSIPFVTLRWSREPADRLAAIRAELNVALTDHILGLADAMAFGREADAHARILLLGDGESHIRQRLAFARGMNTALLSLTAGLAGLAVLLLGISMVTSGDIDGLYLALLPLTAFASFEAVQQIAHASEQIDVSRGAARRLLEFIDEPVPSEEAPRPLPPIDNYEVEFRDVTFSYAASGPPVIDRLSFHIPARGRLAITAPSGWGKTTLVNLLLRFWDCSDGTVFVGGRDASAYDAEDVRRLIGVVPQNVYLFNGTVRDNLLLAKGDATREEIVEACHRAEIHKAIAGLPLGYDTLVGENGFRLSGGERQRLAIARVFLKNAPILVLDEATAHLDASTATRVLDSLNTFMMRKTSLIISHSPEVLELAPCILDLDAGRPSAAAVTTGRASPRSREISGKRFQKTLDGLAEFEAF